MEDIKLKSMIEKDKYVYEESISSNTKSIYPISSLLWCGHTEFCNNVIIANSDEFGRILFTDGELQSTSNDEKIYHEYLIHPSLCIYYSLYNNTKLNVLILGGGEGATTRELLKYSKNSIKKIVWVDIDKDLVRLSRSHLKYCDEKVYDDERVCLHYEDCNHFFKHSQDKFDIIICDLPDPDINDHDGLYSVTFWNDLKNITKTEHIITSHLGPISPGKQNFELCHTILKKINVDMFNYKLGKVFIPSFMSEWLYLYFSFNTCFKNLKLNTDYLPNNVSIIDKENIDHFFYFPKYYEL